MIKTTRFSQSIKKSGAVNITFNGSGLSNLVFPVIKVITYFYLIFLIQFYNIYNIIQYFFHSVFRVLGTYATHQVHPQISILLTVVFGSMFKLGIMSHVK
uniref:Uncharacterized protein n=1 Tax=Cacopsylla melanoneura TaxID=428564 RepID=A0A8D8WVR0_9HEMI